MSEFVKVAARSEIPENGAIAVEARGRRIALFNASGTFYAIDNACRHLGAPLSAGQIYGTRVVCPLHGWEYDFSTGANVDDPEMRVACFAVKLAGDDVFIEI
ncbi:MAG: Rieske 2Fe-2S domain-containing protein [Candidatus Binataceae bacterium]|jgi:nitrite reductase/ring-hydroxylating ferredoxin subunit